MALLACFWRALDGLTLFGVYVGVITCKVHMGTNPTCDPSSGGKDRCSFPKAPPAGRPCRSGGLVFVLPLVSDQPVLPLAVMGQRKKLRLCYVALPAP